MSSGVLKGIAARPVGTRAWRWHRDAGALRFVQISDSHIGFNKPANTDVAATLHAAIAKIKPRPIRRRSCSTPAI